MEVNPPNPPDPPATVIDTVIVKITLDIPSEVILSDITIYVRNSVLKNGWALGGSSLNVRKITFTFIGDEAKLLVGKNVTFTTGFQGRYQDHAAVFNWTNPDESLLLKKGLNEVTLHVSVR